MAKTTSPQCTLPECDNLVPHNPKAKRPRVFCSAACRQKAYRRRHAAVKDNDKFVTFWEQAVDAIDHMDVKQRRELLVVLDKEVGPLTTLVAEVPPESKALTVDELQEQGGYIVYYYSPRSAVIHFNQQNQSYTYCRRKTEKMQVSHALPREAKVCQQCQGRYKEIRG